MFHAWRSHIGVFHMAVDKIKAKKKASTSSGGTAIQRAVSSVATKAYAGEKDKSAATKVVAADVKVSAEESAKIAKEAEIKRAAQAAKDKAAKKSAADIFMRNTR